MAETTLLNKLLKTKKKLFNEKSIFPRNAKLINLLTSLIDKKYEFTQEHFDMFFEQACFKSKWSTTFFDSGNVDTILNINMYMFNTFEITHKHIDTLLQISGYDKFNYLFDILFKKNYKFTIEQYKMLMSTNYYNPPITDVINNNTIYAACIDLVTNPLINSATDSNFNKCLKLLENNYTFNDDHFKILLLCLNRSINLNNNLTKNLKLLLNKLLQFDNVDILFAVMCEIKMLNCYSIGIIYYVLNKFGYNDTFFNYIMETVIKSYPKVILKLILKGYKISIDDINNILENKNFINININEINKYNSIGISSDYLQTYKLANKISLPVINLFTLFNINPDIKTLNTVCKSGNLDCVNILLGKYEIIPDKNTLDISVNTANIELIHKILSYKLTPDSETIKKFDFYRYRSNCKTLHDVMNILIKYGLTITLDDVKHLLTHNFIMEDLERFNIQYDENLYFVCYLSNNYPPEYIEKCSIDQNILTMHKLCRMGQKTALISFLKEHNLRLDYYCMEILLDHPAMSSEIIAEYKCMPLEYSIYRHTKNKELIKYANDKYKVTASLMLEQYDMTP
jgi:hypothetical protein